MKKAFIILLFIIQASQNFAQQGTYTVNGNATQDNCHCYTITPDAFSQKGSVWNNNKINLKQNFNFTFDIFLGCNDAQGADGIAFVLQPISTSVGTVGSGLGYEGISPAIGVTLDTWQNTANSDPTYDHIGIQINGNLSHINNTTNLAGPVTILSNNENAEDCNWHKLRVNWNAQTFELKAYIDDILRVEATQNFIQTIFNNDSLVYWGFTGATGGAKNLQQFCTTLKPAFKSLNNQKRCFGEPITFYDSTASFGTVIKRYWNFGDGSNIDSVSLNPVHTYAAPGQYTVILRVIGSDGCEEILQQIILIGSYPIADFSVGNNLLNNKSCEQAAIPINDLSVVAVGTINNWTWDNGTQLFSGQNPSIIYNTYGNYTLKLKVKTGEGCESNWTAKPFNVHAKPIASYLPVNNKCADSAVQFTSNSNIIEPLATILTTNYLWFNATNNLTNSSTLPNNTQNFVSGNYTVKMIVTSNYECVSDTNTQMLIIRKNPVINFTTSPACENNYIIFTNNSSDIDDQIININWNINGFIFNNSSLSYIVNSQLSIPVQLSITSNYGCKNIKDSILKINKNPTASFFTSSKLCSGNPISISNITSPAPSSSVWVINSVINNNSVWTGVLNNGLNSIQLTVTDINGCKDDSIGILNVLDQPILKAIWDSTCVNKEVQFKAQVISGLFNKYYWQIENTLDSGVTKNFTFTNTGTYTTKLFGTDFNGCISNTETGAILVYQTNANAGPDKTIVAGSPYQLTGNGGVLYEWQPAQYLNNANLQNPIANVNKDIKFTLKAYTLKGCETFDDVFLKVYNGPEIYLPNAFSPNNDGLNDVLKCLPIGIAFTNFTIYNRWGNIVFQTTDYQKGWNGTFKGQKSTNGTYTFVINGVNKDNTFYQKKGAVILVK